MATNFPTSLDSYTTKVNAVDTVNASHVNDLQDAVVAIETILGAGSVASTTFTPQLKFGGAAVSMTGTLVGRHVRLGRLVAVSISITLTAKGSSTGAATVDLPFTVLGTTYGYWIADHRAMASSYVQVGLLPTSGATTCQVRGLTAAGTSTAGLTDAAFTDTSALYLGGLYFA